MAKKLCRYFKKPCLEHQCHQYVNIVGKDPTTGELKNDWLCSDIAILRITIENTQAQRETGAAVESLRNVINTGVAQAARIAELPLTLPTVIHQPTLPLANGKDDT